MKELQVILLPMPVNYPFSMALKGSYLLPPRQGLLNITKKH